MQRNACCKRPELRRHSAPSFVPGQMWTAPRRQSGGSHLSSAPCLTHVTCVLQKWRFMQQSMVILDTSNNTYNKWGLFRQVALDKWCHPKINRALAVTACCHATCSETTQQIIVCALRYAWRTPDRKSASKKKRLLTHICQANLSGTDRTPFERKHHHVANIHLHDLTHSGDLHHVWVHVRYMYLLFSQPAQIRHIKACLVWASSLLSAGREPVYTYIMYVYSLSLSIYIYIYVHTHIIIAIHIYIYIYIYIYILSLSLCIYIYIHICFKCVASRLGGLRAVHLLLARSIRRSRANCTSPLSPFRDFKDTVYPFVRIRYLVPRMLFVLLLVVQRSFESRDVWTVPSKSILGIP